MWGLDMRFKPDAPSATSQDSTDTPSRPWFSMSAASGLSAQQPVSSKAASSSGSLEPPPPRKRMGKQLVKTQFCKHFLRGFCRYQEKCAYAHCSDELVPKPDLQKTKMCVDFLSGTCANHNCSYAHGLQELRPVAASHGGSDVGSASSAMEGPRSYAFGIPHEEQGRTPAPPGLFFSPVSMGESGNARLFDVAEGRNGYRAGNLMRPTPQVDPLVVNERLRQLGLLQRQLMGETQPVVETPATQNWGNLVKALMREQRKKCCAQGKVLLESDRRRDPLTFMEEQMLASLLLGDRYWGDTFPQLTHRCSTMLATRLLSGFQQDVPWAGSSADPRLGAEGLALHADPRGSPSNPQAFTSPYGGVQRKTSHPPAERMKPQSQSVLQNPLASQLPASGVDFEKSGTEVLPPSGRSRLGHRQLELLDMDSLWMSQHPSRQTSADSQVDVAEATSSYDAAPAIPPAGGSLSAARPTAGAAPQAVQNALFGQAETDRLNELLHQLAHPGNHPFSIQRL